MRITLRSSGTPQKRGASQLYVRSGHRMSLFDPIIALVELCFSTLWGLVGVVLGLAAAAAVWHLASHENRAALAAVSYVFVFVACLIVGHKRESKN